MEEGNDDDDGMMKMAMKERGGVTDEGEARDEKWKD